MKSPILSGAALFLIATPVFAACEMPVISVTPGEFSNYQFLNSDELAELAEKHGRSPGGDHVLVIDESDGAGYWIERDRIGEAVMVAGGNPDGFDYSGPDRCVPVDIPIRTTSGAVPGLKGVSPTDVAAAQSGQSGDREELTVAGPQPRPGTWTLQMGDPVVGKCPDMMKASMGHSLASTLHSFFSTKPLRIEAPFHPEQLDFTTATDTTWTKTAPGAWHGETFGEIFATLPSSTDGASGLSWDLIVRSDTEIQHRSRIQIVLPPEAKVAFGGDTCVVTSESTWTWIES